MKLFTPLWAVLWVVAGMGCPAHGQQSDNVSDSEPAPTEGLDFDREIRPLLSEYCFACHGPDAATREGGFRLDEQVSAFGEADSGIAPLVAGDSAASEAIRRMRSTDEWEVMPPPEIKKRPTEQEIKRIAAWIDAGGKWSDHWAFVPPQRPSPPAVEPTDWPRNAIDHFVLARMKGVGLSPSPEASRETLVRRLYLDLIGLPPTPDQVDAFLNDERPDAWERLVDDLLASPHYGEHMASFWLDAARFADTNGYQNDFRRSMWLWRDWVIEAWNANMPYDQFIVEQLAGDMLPEATQSQIIATGFNRNNRTNTEGGSIDEEWLVENVVDRVETTSTVFLGLTMGCARCHDHKYDPISQEEFYRFFAYFHSIDEKGVYTETRGNVEPLIRVVTPEYQRQIDALKQRLLEAMAERERVSAKMDEGYRDWLAGMLETDAAATDDILTERSVGINGPAPTHAITDLVNVEGDAPPHRLHSGFVGAAVELTASGHQPVDLGDWFDFDAAKGFTVATWFRADQFGAIISRMDEANAYRGFDMLLNPDGRLSVHLIHDWPANGTKVTTEQPLERSHWNHLVVTCRAPGKAADISVWVNGNPVELQVDSDSLNGDVTTDFPVWLGFRGQTQPFVGEIGSVDVWSRPVSATEAKALYRRGLRIACNRGNQREADASADEHAAELQRHFRMTQPEYEAARTAVADVEAELKAVHEAAPTTMVMRERKTPRETYVLKRGQYDQPDKDRPVQPGIPALFQNDAAPRNRLELAQWLVADDNPLTARVAVNHVWQRLFGSGLVSTPENFGVQASPPSHPMLLDWLACEFRDTGWDVKRLIRLIVTSATYRQVASATPETFAADPDNVWLARGPRFRLPAEAIRDNALAISGLLSRDIGGPSVKPYQPEGLWAELAGGAGEPPYVQASGDDLYRRSLYIYRKRTVPHPTMATFDAGGRDVCTVSRSRTNTPLQALALMNDVTYVEAARVLAARVLQEQQTPRDRLRIMFRRATARWPMADELEVLEDALSRYSEHFANDPEAATKWVAIGNSVEGRDADPVALAALGHVASLVLNLDEVVTKE